MTRAFLCLRKRTAQIQSQGDQGTQQHVTGDPWAPRKSNRENWDKTTFPSVGGSAQPDTQKKKKKKAVLHFDPGKAWSAESAIGRGE